MNNTATTRHLSLDFLRGIAVMGILAMNIIAFSMPEQAYFNPIAWGGTRAADLGIWAFNMVLVDGKMRGLFSLLFGASMLLVAEGAAAKGESAAGMHYRRMFWLMLFGLAHYYLIWFGDILFLYAVIGMIGFAFRGREAGSLIKWGIVFIAISFAIMALTAAAFLFIQHEASQPGATAAILASHQQTLGSIGAPDTAPLKRELAIYSGDYAGILAFRTTGPGLYYPLTTVLMSGFETLGFMLIGMALLKNGFLTGTWPAGRYRSVAIRAYLFGLPPMIGLCGWCFASGFDPVTTFGAVFALAMPFRLILIVGHAALALWFVTTHAQSPAVRRIAAAGRVAFTNYLGTSIVMTTIFYGYGLGLYGEVSRATVYGFVVTGWAVMLFWSKPWLERFAYGPLEWLWRSLARGRMQSLRRI